MSNARNLADVISGNYDVPAGSLDNVDLSSRVAKSGDTMTGNLNQVKSMTSQYDGIGVLMGSSTANTNRSATFLQHTYIDAGGNQGNYVYNHSLRQTDGAYIANVYTADYSTGVHSWYNPNGGLSGNTVMSIDSAGRVTMPYQPSFKVSGNHGSAGNVIKWNVISLNVGSHYNSSTGRFTVPVSGVYVFFAKIFVSSTGTHQITVRSNGGSLAELKANTSEGAYNSQGATTAVYLSANDWVEVGYDSGSYLDGVQFTYFGGYLIG